MISLATISLIYVLVNAPVFVGTYEITAYHATTRECDATPEIGAGGRVAINEKPLGHFFASNCFPLGSKIILPNVSNHVWTCKDRMNKRFPRRIDLLLARGVRFKTCKTEVYLVE